MKNNKTNSASEMLAAIFLLLGPTLVAHAASRLLDGQLSVMHPESDRARERMAPKKVPFTAPDYTARKACHFSETITVPNQSPIVTKGNLTISQTSHGLVTVVNREGTGPTTVLMTERGELVDENGIDPLTKRRVTADNRAEDAAKQIAATADANHVVDQMALIVPHYKEGPFSVGDTAAIIPDESGAPWGELVYRGIIDDSQKSVALFDLVRKYSGRAAVAGFATVDSKTLTPYLVVLDSGSLYQLERQACE